MTASNDAGSAVGPVTLRVVDEEAPPAQHEATPTPAPTPGPLRPAADTTAPKISALKAVTSGKAFSAFVKTGALAVSLRVSERVSVAGELLLPASNAKKLKIKGASVTEGGKKYVLVGRSAPVPASGNVKLTVKVSKVTAKKLGKQKRLAFVLRVKATDAARNAGVNTAAITLRKR